MRALSLRTRLTVAFALAMAAVVTGLGVFVYGEAADSMRHAVDQGLRARAADVANLANQADNGLSSATGPLDSHAQNFGQLILPNGHIYDQSPGLPRRSLLTHAQITRAGHGAYFIDVSGGTRGVARAFVEPVRAQDRSLILLVATSLSDQRSALAGLRAGLLIGGPVAVLLAALGGYLLAGAALRPVERMRARAAGVSPESQGARLPVPRGTDEIARLGQTLNAMLGRLEQARERERRFLADASHELRTPLALLKTEIELALDGRHTVEELLASLRSARAETDRLVQLSEDLLLLAQSDQGVLPVRIVPVGAAELAERTAARFGPRAAGESREIQVDAPRDLTLLADPLRMEQALANLVDNSLRYGAGRITIQVEARGDEVELHVRDQGGGIPPELRSAAFERFTRNDPARHDGGAGLGLAIVAVIARAHGGAAEIGHGSDMFIRLPSVSPCTAQARAFPSPSGPRSCSPGPPRGIRPAARS